MDSKTTVKELKNQVQKFCEDRDWDQYHDPKELAIGVSTESGELLDLFRFKSQKQMAEMLNDPERRERIAEELADVLYFVVRFSQRFGFDLSEGLKTKLEKNEKKYPIERSKGSNKKYNEV